MSAKAKGPPKPSGDSGLRRWLARTNLLTSVVLVFPLFLFYQLGVVLSPKVGNGADLITSLLLGLRQRSPAAYWTVHATLVLAFVALLLILRRRQEFRVRMFLPVMLESALYALTMGALIVEMMALMGIDPSLHVEALHVQALQVRALPPLAAPSGLPEGVFVRLALAVGAGVHEELVFRLILLSGVVALLHDLGGMRRGFAIALAFVVTSLVFSAAHHVVGGEPWRVGVFVYRFFCGLVFAAIFQWRGFAVAVYTHALYDIYVMVLR